MIPHFSQPHLLNRWQKNNDMLICTMANGKSFMEMQNIMAPTLQTYAEIHKMDSLILPLYDERLDASRPYAWDKIILINHMLQFYDTVMWMDSDCIICHPWADIRLSLYPHCVMHVTKQQYGEIANTGVWVVRSNQQSKGMLQAIWDNTPFIHHPWWEQAALLDLMGYQFGSGSSPEGVTFNRTPFCEQIGFLDTIWNSCCSRITEHTIIKHYCGPKNDDVYQMMRQDYADFMNRVGSL